jgi:hypothetical protein
MANLYVFHQGIGGDGIYLWYSVFDGTNWAPDTPVLRGALDLSDPPSAVAWADGISALHQGWNRQGRPPGRRTALVHVFPWWHRLGRRYPCSEREYVGLTLGSRRRERQSLCLPPGSNEDGQLWYTYFDGTNWAPDTPVSNLGMSSSPSAVAWAGGMTVFHQGFDLDEQLWYSYFNGTNWGTDTQVQNVGISGSPNCVVV